MNLSKSKIFLICCLVFIIGVAIASFLPIKWIQNDLWWFAGIINFNAILVLFWQNKNIRLAVLIGLFLFLGLWRYAIGLPINTPDKIWHYNGQTVTVAGVVVNEPDIRQKNQKLEVVVKRLNFLHGNLASFEVDGKILVTTNLYPGYNYGDELEIICKLRTPERFKAFAYGRYLARYDIYSICYYPNIELIGRSDARAFSTAWFYKKIFSFKNKLREIINYGLSEPEASLGRAIILGDKKAIPDNLREKFAQAGISHIVAISGLHISVFTILIMSLLLGIGLSRGKAFWLAVIFLVGYIILIGLPSSAIRAGLMGFLALWAMNLGRLNKLTNSLILTAAVLLLINPKLLRDDISFQLSFLAVLGIAYCYPVFNKWFFHVILDRAKQKSHEMVNVARKTKFLAIPGMTEKLKNLFNIINITIAAQILTLPIIAFNFSQVSIVALITNLLILWIIPIFMLASLIALGLGLIFPNFIFLFFLPALLLLRYIIVIVEQLTRLPYAYIKIDYLWRGWAIIYYLVVGWAVYKARRKVKDEL